MAIFRNISEIDQLKKNKDKTVSKKEYMKFRFGVFERFDDDQNEALDHEEYRRWLESQ